MGKLGESKADSWLKKNQRLPISNIAEPFVSVTLDVSMCGKLYEERWHGDSFRPLTSKRGV